MMQHVLRAVYPERVVCVLCSRPSRGELLCSHCAQDLEALRLDGTRDRACYRYEGAAKALIHRLKFDNVTAAATVLARAMSRDVMAMHPAPDTVLTWVTMPGERRLARGIDHGQVLARALGLRLGFPAEKLMDRREEVPQHTQRGLNRAERLINLRGAFVPRADLPRHILLVDDVFTTGATMETCTQCLRREGVHVSFITAAKVV